MVLSKGSAKDSFLYYSSLAACSTLFCCQTGKARTLCVYFCPHQITITIIIIVVDFCIIILDIFRVEITSEGMRMNDFWYLLDASHTLYYLCYSGERMRRFNYGWRRFSIPCQSSLMNFCTFRHPVNEMQGIDKRFATELNHIERWINDHLANIL